MTAAPEPFRRVQAQYDADLARILEATARSVRARINRSESGIGGQVRAAQLTLVLRAVERMLTDMWTGPVLATTQRGREAAAKAAETAVETLTRPLYRALPGDVADAITAGLRAAAESGIMSDFARVPRQLSQRVYQNAALTRGVVNQLIRTGLQSGLSARELAVDVYRYVSPSTPGGASYAAMRLARTEINNAFHERQIEAGKRPGVRAIKWNLSGSHKVPDLCNVYAAHGGKGEWPVGAVPDKPHPQCFCYLTYVTMTSHDFVNALSSGKFDDELDRRTKANLERLGQSTAPAPKKIGVKPRKGTDQTEWARTHTDDLMDVDPKDPSSVDGVLTNIANRQGWDAKPGVGTRADVNAAVAAGWTEVFRGVTGDQHLTTGDLLDIMRGKKGKWKLGTGIYGNGAYFSDSHDTAFKYAHENEAGVVRAAINPAARIIDYNELKKQNKADWQIVRRKLTELERGRVTPSEIEPTAAYESIIADTSRWAALKGYDVIKVTGEHDGHQVTDQYIVLNRTVLLIEDKP